MNDDEHPSATPGQGSPATDRVTAVLRRGGVVEHPPPPHVWDGVVSGVDHGRASAPVRLVGGPATGRRANARRTWSGSATRLLAAAAVGALVTWAGFELVGRETPAELLVSGELAALTGDGTEGRAEVVDVDGQQRLRVELAGRPPVAGVAPHPELHADTRLWAALQQVSGGTWGGCVYDVDAITARLA